MTTLEPTAARAERKLFTPPARRTGPPKVSIMLITYNHVKFIGQAIESILMQETEYDYEINVIEDCSTDGTQDVIMRYVRQYPDIVKPYLNKRNIGTLDPPQQKVTYEGFKTLNGEYISILEGDDYWSSPQKLQKQVAFLDANPDFAACAHNTVKIYEDGSQEPHRFLYWKGMKPVHTIHDFVAMTSFFHTSSILYRNVFKGVPPRVFRSKWSVDIFNTMAHVQFGKLRYFDEDMSVYRAHRGGAGISSRNTEAGGRIHNIDALRRYNRWLGYRYVKGFAFSLNRLCQSLLLETGSGKLPPLEKTERIRLSLIAGWYGLIYDVLYRLPWLDPAVFWYRDPITPSERREPKGGTLREWNGRKGKLVIGVSLFSRDVRPSEGVAGATHSIEIHPPSGLNDGASTPWGSTETDEDTYFYITRSRPFAPKSISLVLFTPAGRAHLCDVSIVAGRISQGQVADWTVLKGRMKDARGYAERIAIPKLPDETIVEVEIEPGYPADRFDTFGFACFSRSLGYRRNWLDDGKGIYVREMFFDREPFEHRAPAASSVAKPAAPVANAASPVAAARVPPNQFRTALIAELVANRRNDHADNFDAIQQGPEPPADEPVWRQCIGEMKRSLREDGFWRDGLVAPLRRAGRFYLVPHRYYAREAQRLGMGEFLYNLLADQPSKDLLLKLLAYRILGHRKVKLPRNNPSYWRDIEAVERLRTDRVPMKVKFMDLSLPVFDLAPLGYDIRCHAPVLGIAYAFVQKQYEYHARSAHCKAEAGDIVIDAGGCWGDTTLYFAHEVGNRGKVVSFEFIPSNLAVMRRNIELNPHLGARTVLVTNPIWSHSGLRLYYVDWGPDSRVTSDEKQYHTPDGTCETVTIDEVAERERLPRVDFIKMDIEGAELEALRGAERTIRRHRPKLAISLYHKPDDFETIPRYLAGLDLGYEFYLEHHTIYANETVLFGIPSC